MHSIIERIANAIASMMLFLLACITLIDVIGRNFFSSPLAPATELTEVALVVITFLLYPQIAFRNEHITVDLLDFFLPAWFRRMVRCSRLKRAGNQRSRMTATIWSGQ